MTAECEDSVKYAVVEQFADYAATVGAREILRINGVRAEFDDGWFLVRASSNLPALVMLAEGVTAERLLHMYRLLRDGLDQFSAVSRIWENDPWQELGQSGVS